MMMGKMASTVQVTPLGYSFGEVTVRPSSPKTYRTSSVNIFDQLYIACGFQMGSDLFLTISTTLIDPSGFKHLSSSSKLTRFIMA